LNLMRVAVDHGQAQLGGGVFATGCTTTITDTTLTANDGPTDGGGLLTLTSGKTTLTRVTATGNTSAGDGGGIAVLVGAQLDLVDSMVTGNSAPNGGGVYIEDVVTCTTSTITGNPAGNGVFLAGNAASFTSTSCNYGGNTPHDVAGSQTANTFDFGSGASFACTAAGCQ
jgi:hypothetical protein